MRRLICVAIIALLIGCGSEQPISTEGSENTTSIQEVGESAPLASEENLASKSLFSSILNESDLIDHCLDLSLLHETTDISQSRDGSIRFFSTKYAGGHTPAFITELSNVGILENEGLVESPDGSLAEVFRPTSGNEGSFRWRDSRPGVRNNRGGTMYFCPGDISVTVTNFSEPADKLGRTDVSYDFAVADVHPIIKSMI